MPSGGCASLLKAKVVQFVRNENPTLWKTYVRRKADIPERHRGHNTSVTPLNPGIVGGHECLDAPTNEWYLFHGTSEDVAEIIAQNGFDERLANMGGLYGAGVYFAEEACKSHQYTRPNAAGTAARGSKYCSSNIGRGSEPA